MENIDIYASRTLLFTTDTYVSDNSSVHIAMAELAEKTCIRRVVRFDKFKRLLRAFNWYPSSNIVFTKMRFHKFFKSMQMPKFL